MATSDEEEPPNESIELAAEELPDESEPISAPEGPKREVRLSPDGLSSSDGSALEPVQHNDTGSYWVVSGMVVFGVTYEEGIRLHANLSEEAWQQHLDEWSSAGIEVVLIEPIALRQPDNAIMEIMRSSTETDSWKVHSLHLNRRDFSMRENPAVSGTDGVRLWIRMEEGKPQCVVGLDQWKNGRPDNSGDLGRIKAGGGIARKQFQWHSTNHRVLLTLEKVSQENLEGAVAESAK